MRGGTVAIVAGGVLGMRLVGLALLASAVIKRTDAEKADHILQGFGLRRELLGSTGELLCAGSVALRDQANLADGSINLIHASSLLSGRCSYFLHQVRGLLNGRDEFGQQTARTFGDLNVGGGQSTDFLCRSAAPLREVADFACDHGESTAMFAGAGRFDGSIQGQHVSLIGDL